MAKVMVMYYSRTGKTKQMAELVARGIETAGVEVLLKDACEVKPEDFFDYDGIVIGSPTYYGTMSWEIKKILDDSVKYHGRLDGKAGAAFSSSANVGGGNETTVLDILHAMLIHGMIIQGDPLGDHYGAVSINAPDARSAKQCERMGQRFAALVKRLIKQ